MSSTLVTRTPRAALAPVNTKLTGQYDVLMELLRRRFGPDHAGLFAEPAPAAGGAIAWFAAEEGEPVPVGSLTDHEAAGLRQTAGRLVADLQALAEKLEGEGPASRDAAKLLRDALVVPDGEALWSVGGRPVLVGWGHRRADARETASAPAFVTAVASAGEAVPIAIASQSGPSSDRDRPSASPHRWPWLPILAFVLALILLLLLGARLLRACTIGAEAWPAVIRAVLPNACPAPVASEGTRSALARLDAEIATRERELTARALTCSASRPPAVEQRVDAIPAPRDEPESRLENVQRGRYLEVTLLWEGAADLDLHISCPNGGSIRHDNRVACGGTLVTDLNVGGGTALSRPIEHIIWDGAPAPAGTYRVSAALYDRHGDTRSDIPYRIVLWRGGRQIRQEAGTLSSAGQREQVLTFDSPLEP